MRIDPQSKYHAVPTVLEHKRRRVIYLRTARRRSGLSQAELSTRAGVSQPHICRLEKSPPARPVGPTTTRRLAIALGIDPGVLRFGPDPTVVTEAEP